MYLLEFAGEDDAFAACEAASAAVGVEPIAPGLATAGAVDADRVRGLAYTRRASRLLGRSDADLESARTCLEAARLDPDRAETVAVRATDVRGSTGISTSEAERVLGQVLVDRGFSVDLDDPDHTLRAAFSAGRVGGSRDAGSAVGGTERDGEAVLDEPVADPVATDASAGGDELPATDATADATDATADAADDLPATDPSAANDASADEPTSVCALGWLVAESVRDFAGRKPTEKPFFQPGSMDPQLARAVANVAGARPGATVLDPMCGTGGVLVEAGLVGADVVGTDAQSKMVRGACENLAHYLDADSDGPDTPAGGGEQATTEPALGTWHLARADATRLPLADDAVDAVVFDAPYGRQSKIATHRLEDLVAGALTEARRVAPRAVVVADRPWIDPARAAGWTIEAAFERRVHRSLTRYVLVLEG